MYKVVVEMGGITLSTGLYFTMGMALLMLRNVRKLPGAQAAWIEKHEADFGWIHVEVA